MPDLTGNANTILLTPAEYARRLAQARREALEEVFQQMPEDFRAGARYLQDRIAALRAEEEQSPSLTVGPRDGDLRQRVNDHERRLDALTIADIEGLEERLDEIVERFRWVNGHFNKRLGTTERDLPALIDQRIAKALRRLAASGDSKSSLVAGLNMVADALDRGDDSVFYITSDQQGDTVTHRWSPTPSAEARALAVESLHLLAHKLNDALVGWPSFADLDRCVGEVKRALHLDADEEPTDAT